MLSGLARFRIAPEIMQETMFSKAIPCAAYSCLCVALTISSHAHIRADVFGSGTNTFTIDFVEIDDVSNPADTTGFGSVSYLYKMAMYEVSQSAIDKATANGMTNVAAGAWTGNQPAALMTWYESAAFVNWLNTSTGRQAAYNLTFSGGVWSMSLWNVNDAWTLGGTNLFRNKNAYYFLPSENEWYKAAYYSGTGSTYFDYPTGSDTAPAVVASGTAAGTAVYASLGAPAAVDSAGGLSPYGTRGQGGNVWEWSETAVDGVNNVPSENRIVFGTAYNTGAVGMLSTYRGNDPVGQSVAVIGLRVAAVPEPSTWAIALAGLACGGFSVCRRRKQRGRREDDPALPSSLAPRSHSSSRSSARIRLGACHWPG